MKTLPSTTEMQRAYLAGDSSYVGVFWLGVKTTGIFCKPGCPARKPRPENVEYFHQTSAALTAGYRPCKRCKPIQEDTDPPWVTSLLAEIERDPTIRIRDSALAARGIDPSTARRYFQRRFGMTFQAFVRARRLSGALHIIREGGKIDDAVFESGYESHSGFRDAFARAFGSAPGKGSTSKEVFLIRIDSPLGPLLAGATAEGICLLEFTDRRMLEKQLATVGRLFRGTPVFRANEHLEKLRAELARYFDGSLRKFSVPLIYPGTPFQRRVWEELLRIPYGETRSYEDLARAVGVPFGARAVGRANGLNRIAIAIPCHRIVNKDGQLGGYGGGLRRKEALLDLERKTINFRAEKKELQPPHAA